MKGSILERLELAGKLPTPPGVLQRLLVLTRSTDTSVRDVAGTISADPALAAKILRFVNSPMAGVGREVLSLQQAVALIGIRGVTTMALSLAVIGSRNQVTCSGFDRDQYNVQSVACGTIAKVLARLTGAFNPQDAFSAGLFSQIGRSVFAAALPEEYSSILAQSKCAPRDLPELEKEVFGESFPSLGAQLLRKWGLPEAMCGAIQVFREDQATPGYSVLARLLNCAELGAGTLCPQPSDQPPNAHEFLQAANRDFGLTDSVVAGAIHEMLDEINAIRKVLEIPLGNVRTAEEIESEVRERIAELSISMHLENQSMAIQQADLLRRASTDALTGIGNRSAFDARMELEVDRMIRNGSPLGLLLIDVDKFKSFNDTHGHQAGDRVLQTVARVLDENVRKMDFVARYGGEEFAVIAPGTPTDGILLLAERLRKGVQDASVPWDGRQLSVTISVGAALFTELVGRNDIAGIIRVADEQLYKAKDSGRNRVSCHTVHHPSAPTS